MLVAVATLVVSVAFTALVNAHSAASEDRVTEPHLLPEDLWATSAVWNPGDGVAYTFGGFKPVQNSQIEEASSHFITYDPSDGSASTEQWSSDPLQEPVPRAETGAVWDETQGFAYVFGGRSGELSQLQTLNSTLRVDPGDGGASFTTLSWPAGLDGRTGVSAVWNEGEDVAYIFGGRTGDDEYLGDILKFDPNAPGTGITNLSKGENGVKLSPARAYTSAVWDEENGVAYIVGGEKSGGSVVGKIVKFDPSGPSLKRDWSLPKGQARSRTSAVWNGSHVLVFGGEDGSDAALKESFRFDPSGGTTDRWHDLTGPLKGTSAALDGGNGTAYIFAGKDDGGSLSDDVQHYDASPVTHDPDIRNQTGESIEKEAIVIEKTPTGARVKLKARNPHDSCSPGHVGCDMKDQPHEVSVYAFDDHRKLSKIGTTFQDARDQIERKIAGTEPLQSDTKFSFQRGDKTVAVNSVPLNSLRPGRNVTVVGVIDGCDDRYRNQSELSSDSGSDALTDGYVATVRCALQEIGDDPDSPQQIKKNQQNVYFTQWMVTPLPIEVSSTLIEPDTEAQLHENGTKNAPDVKLGINVTNTADFQLKRRLTVHVTDDTGLDRRFHFTEDFARAGEGGSTLNRTLEFVPDVAGDRNFTLEVIYPNPKNDANNPANHPHEGSARPAANVSANRTLYFKAADFALDQSASPVEGFPHESNVTVSAQVKNVGDFRAHNNGRSALTTVWKRCDRLEQGTADGTPYVCDEAGEFGQIDGSALVESRTFRDGKRLDSLTPGGSVSESVTWNDTDQSAGVWTLRGDIDGAFFSGAALNNWGKNGEHARDNNIADTEVELTNLTWSGPTFQAGNFSTADARFNHTLTIANRGNEDSRKVTIARADRECIADKAEDDKDKDRKDCSLWTFRLFDSTGSKLADSDDDNWDVSGGTVDPPTVTIPAGGQTTLNFEVQTPTVEGVDGALPGDFTNVSLVVCDTDKFNSDTGACTGHGDIVDLNTSFEVKWKAGIKTVAGAQGSVDPGESVSFHFWASNEAKNVHDAFQLRTAVQPSGQGITASVVRTDPVGDGDDLFKTRDPNPDDAEPASPQDPEDVSQIDLAPGERNRFRLDVNVPQSVSEGTNVSVTVRVESLNASEAGTFDSPLPVASKTFSIGVGQDVGPPTIKASPTGGAVVRPGVAPTGTPITFTITDDGEVTSVSRSINNGTFKEFQTQSGNAYTVPTTGRPDGRLAIRVRAQDDTGKVADRTFVYRIDDSRPRFQSLETFPSTVAANGSVELIVSVQEPNVASVTADLGGRTVNLSRSGSGLYRATIAAPSDPGLYTVNVTAVDAATPTPNRRSTSTEVEVVQPDIQLGDQVTIEPTTPEPNEPTTIRASLTNPSGAELAEYPVVLVVDGETYARANLTLLPNKQTQVSFEWQGEVGTHDATIRADPNGTFDDPDRSNNAVSFTIRVQSGGFLGLPGPEIYIIAAAVVVSALLRRRWDARDTRDPDQGDT